MMHNSGFDDFVIKLQKNVKNLQIVIPNPLVRLKVLFKQILQVGRQVERVPNEPGDSKWKSLIFVIINNIINLHYILKYVDLICY